MCPNIYFLDHPLAGAKQKTLKEVSSETLGIYSKKFDEKGIAIVRNETVKLAGYGTDVSSVAAPVTANPLYDDPIPKKSTWFKETQGDKAYDNWDSEQEYLVDIQNDNASNSNADEKEAYM